MKPALNYCGIFPIGKIDSGTVHQLRAYRRRSRRLPQCGGLEEAEARSKRNSRADYIMGRQQSPVCALSLRFSLQSGCHHDEGSAVEEFAIFHSNLNNALLSYR